MSKKLLVIDDQTGITKVVEMIARQLGLNARSLNSSAQATETFIAFKPDLFLPAEEYRREVRRRIDVIKATPRQMGVAEIRIPGERGYATRARLMREGIEIDRKIYNALGRLAQGELDHGG